jgi:hypothetical protein
MKSLADEFLVRPRGHDDVCSVTQCTLPICKYYKQCSFNCVELGFFDNLRDRSLFIVQGGLRRNWEGGPSNFLKPERGGGALKKYGETKEWGL